MILPVLILGLVFRLINLNQSLWLDEAINVVFAQKLDLFDYLTKYLIADFHPPGWFLVLWVWGHLFGFSEISVRMPALIFGLLTIFLTYKIGEELISKKVGLMASLFLSLAPLHIYYSQEARPYSFAAFAAAMSTYCLVKLIKKGKLIFLIFYAFSLTLLFSSDYLTYLILPAHFIYSKFYKNIPKFLWGNIFAFLMFSPWLLIFPGQITNGQQTAIIVKGWGEVVGSLSIKGVGLLAVKILLGRISFDNKWIYSFVVLLISVPYFLSIKNTFNNLSKQITFLFLWFLVPIVFAILISLIIPVFSYFRFIFILPAFYILVAVGLERTKKNWQKYFIVCLILFETVPSLIYLLDSQFHREDWKGSVSFLAKSQNANSVILFENSEVLAPFVYYNKDNLVAIGALKKIPVENLSQLIDLESIAQKNKKLYLFEYLVDITDPKRLVETNLKDLNYANSKTYNFRGIGFIREYVK